VVFVQVTPSFFLYPLLSSRPGESDEIKAAGSARLPAFLSSFISIILISAKLGVTKN